MMDEWSWAQKMGGEDDKSGQRQCVGWQWMIEQRASVRMLDEQSWASKMGKEDDESELEKDRQN